MSDSEGDESVPKGNEWEVVALTDSTYAASTGPKEDISDSSFFGVENPETARALFMSGHFGSPSKQETVPREGEHNIPPPTVEHCGKLDSKKEGDINMEGLVSEGDNISFYTSDFGDVVHPNLMGKEQKQSIYDTGKSGSFQGEADSGINEPVETMDRSNTSEISDMPKDDEFSNFSHETWWRKHAASIYAHTKNVNPVLSVLVAAAVVGLVIVGYRWQRGKQQITQLKPRWTVDDEGSRWILGPVTQLKDVTLGVQSGPYIRVLSAGER